LDNRETLLVGCMKATEPREIAQDTQVNPNSYHIVRCLACGATDGVPFLTAPDRFRGKSTSYKLRRCSTCSHVWLSNPPSPAEIGEHYGSDYDLTISAAAESASRSWKRERETLLRHKASGTILDLGCSSGSFLATLRHQFASRFGVEMSSEMAQRAGRNSGAAVFVGDILEASFAPGSFDAVTCFHVLEHMYDPREVVARVSKWLKPGGVFYVLVPNIDAGEFRIFQSYWYPLELPRHLSHFCPASLLRMCEARGFEAQSLSTFRVNFIEPSTRYVTENIKAKFGLSVTPLSEGERANLPWRIIRKMLRMTVFPLVEKMESFAGAGEIIEGLFVKR
jgi:SAM-dependent methyltransferase